MYKCVDCGHIFEECAVWYEDRGEFWGASCSERMEGCPKCRGYFEEASECKECGKIEFDDELIDGLCRSCREEKEG